MKEWKSINLNETVRFKLKPEGEKIWLDYWREFSTGKQPTLPKTEDGWREDQLWHLMQVFGKHIHLGFDLPIETKIQVQL